MFYSVHQLQELLYHKIIRKALVDSFQAWKFKEKNETNSPLLRMNKEGVIRNGEV